MLSQSLTSFPKHCPSLSVPCLGLSPTLLLVSLARGKQQQHFRQESVHPGIKNKCRCWVHVCAVPSSQGEVAAIRPAAL